MAFAALFWLFSAGMFTSSIQFAALNVTTIENFERRRKVWYVCVYLPRPEEVLGRLERQGRMVPRTIPYPRPAEENAVILQDALGQEAGASGTRGIDDLPPTQATRTFAILGVTGWCESLGLWPPGECEGGTGAQFPGLVFAAEAFAMCHSQRSR